MTAIELLADLAKRGIRLKSQSGRLRYFPKPAATPDVVDRMKAQKLELLGILRHSAGLGLCVQCGNQLYAVPTFDGFENAECPSCGRSLGCIPATGEAIARFGQRTWADVLPGELTTSNSSLS